MGSLNMMVVRATILLCITGIFVNANIQFKHHNNTELAAILQQVHNKCPDISRLYTLSEPSVEGVPLYVLEVSDNPGHHELTEPEMKYVANMHGNEVLGRELLLHLSKHICQSHLEGDKDMKQLVHSTRIHILPSMNPDRWKISTDNGAKDYLIGRNNANNVDLNRDFPDLNQVVYEGAEENNHLLREANFDHRIQPETESMIKMIMDTPFVLSANMHGGDLVANYPYDESRTGDPTQYTPSPDDMTFRNLASVYAGNHPRMSNPATPGCDSPVNEFIWAAHWGIKGVVRDSLTGDGIAAATVHVRNISRLDKYGRMQSDITHDVTSASKGDYWRLLTDGEYEIIVEAEGYEPQAKLVQVNNGHKEATRLDFDLVPVTEVSEEEKDANAWMMYNDVLSQQDPLLDDYHDYYRP